MKEILIVDDDVYIGDMLEESLKKEGYGIKRAYSGTEALLLLSSSRPDLALLDLMLPAQGTIKSFPFLYVFLYRRLNHIVLKSVTLSLRRH